MAVKKRGVSGRAEALADRKAWGMEPEVPETMMTQLEIGKALTWYNYMSDTAQARKWLLEYLLIDTKNADRYTAVKRAPEKAIRPTAGYIARLLILGAILPEETMTTFDRLVEDSTRIRIVDDEEEGEKVVEAPKPTIQQRMAEKAGDYIADFEDVLDGWENRKDFSAYKYLSEKQVAPKLVGQIIAYYKPLLAELDLVKKDDQVKEAYLNYGTMRMTKYKAFVTNLIVECERYVGVTKAAKPRKPRKTKAKDPSKKVAKLKYLKDFATLQIKSANPANVIGCQEVWLFETKYNRLTVLRSDGPKGLDIKGQTVVGFDPTQSLSKVVGRKTQAVIDGVLRGTKTQAKKVFNEASATAKEANGRINENTIILRIVK